MDGAYRCGMLMQWERCFVIPADAYLLVTEALKTAATHLTTSTCNPATGTGLRELKGTVDRWDRLQHATDCSVLLAGRQAGVSWGGIQPFVALKLRQCISVIGRGVMEQYVSWFQTPRREDVCMRAFQDGVALFAFEERTVQKQPHRTNNVYEMLPYSLGAKVDPALATAVRQYLIAYHAGNKGAEMLERSLEALAFVGAGAGLDKVLVIRDDGRKGKTARSILRKTVQGPATSAQAFLPSMIRLESSCATIYSRKSLTLTRIQRPILFALSSESPTFVRKPFGRDADQINWSWKSVLIVLYLICVPRIDAPQGDAGKKRFCVVERP